MLLWDPPLPCFSSFVNDENSIIFLTPSPPIVPFSPNLQFFFLDVFPYWFVLILLLLKIHVTCWEQKMLHYFLRFVRLSEKVYNWVICIVDTSLTIILLNSIFCLQLFLDKIVLSHIQRNWFIFVNWILKSFITKTEKEINDYMLKCIQKSTM